MVTSLSGCRLNVLDENDNLLEICFPLSVFVL